MHEKLLYTAIRIFTSLCNTICYSFVKAAWKERLALMEAEGQKAAEKYRELLSQNERLHGQAEQLTSQLKVFQRQAQGDDDNLSTISGFSTTEKTAEELWDIIR